MPVSKDPQQGILFTNCEECNTRLRYAPRDAVLPPRERSGVEEPYPIESTLHREIICVECGAPVRVPIPYGDPYLRPDTWPEVKKKAGEVAT